MKYWSCIPALLCAVLQFASAQPPQQQRSSGRPFGITGFVATGDPYTLDGDDYLSYAEYNITTSPGEGNTWCWARSRVSDLSIGDIHDYPCSADKTIKWSFTNQSTEHNFTVSWQYTGHGKLIGTWMIPDSQVQWVTNDDGLAVQQYVGPAEFTVPTEDVFGRW